jgi:signal transduction histidine kinase
MAALPGRTGDDRFAGEQAALRRVATLVARGTPPAELFAAVTEEAARLLGADHTMMARYDPDDTICIVGVWSSTGAPYPLGTQARLGGRNVPTLVFETGRPARMDDYDAGSGAVAEAVRDFGFRAAVGVPVNVEGGIWGAMIAASCVEPLPAGTEAQLAGFTELAATAIASAQARVELRGYAEEQAALRQVAVLVAQGASPEEVFAAITREAGRLLGADRATMARYSPDGGETVLAAWDSAQPTIPVGTRWNLGGRNMQTMVFQTGQPARIDDYASASGAVAEAVRAFGLRAAVGVPVSVEGRLWGVMVVASRAGPLPAGTEARLAGFTELAATAIANAETQSALAASRARIVATADATRRRIERNLHDGAQQRLVSLALELRAAEAAAAAGTGDLAPELDRLAAGLDGVLADLREIARGLHPAVLTESGLAAALKTLARRAAIPVSVNIQIEGRLPEPVGTAAYYTIAEALTNAAKHASATAAEVEVTAGEGVLRVRVRDDGRGGANFGDGTGLVGLRDRAEVLGGHLRLDSPPGAGTTLEITIPLADSGQRFDQPGAAQPADRGPSGTDRNVRPPG